MLFKFCKENKSDQEFEMSLDELKDQFKDWLKTKDKDWLAYYSRYATDHFVGEKTGLNSTCSPETSEKLQELLSDTKWEYLNSIGIK